MELTLKEKQKLTAVTAKKYRTANKKDKTKILDTFIAQAGFKSRKHAIHILANEDREKYIGKKLKAKTTHRILSHFECIEQGDGPSCFTNRTVNNAKYTGCQFMVSYGILSCLILAKEMRKIYLWLLFF